MSAAITEAIVREQLKAMGSDAFDIGVLRQNGRMLLRERWGEQQIIAAVAWLKHENARGAHIFVRPHGEHALSLIDDLTAEAVVTMEASGFEPAVLVETSPGNFQAWLNHGRVLNRELSTRVARELARRFGGDPSSADMAWALHAASRGLSEQEIEAEILHARDLSKKGGIRQQLEYARRTAEKAAARTQPLHP